MRRGVVNLTLVWSMRRGVGRLLRVIVPLDMAGDVGCVVCDVMPFNLHWFCQTVREERQKVLEDDERAVTNSLLLANQTTAMLAQLTAGIQKVRR